MSHKSETSLPILLFVVLSLIVFGNSLSIGNIIPNSLLSIPVQIDGSVVNAKLAVDSSWHWLHSAINSSKGCLTNGWNKEVCHDPDSCWKECVIEGISAQQWSQNYGISVNSDALTIGYVTGNNVGSRMYLLQASGQKYLGLNLLARELSFDADMSKAGCGLNGALYFVQMPLDGGPNLSSGSPSTVGLGYCDAQCPTVDFINGKAAGVQGYYPNGACCAQFDVWQANSEATQMATHTCKNPGLFQCKDDFNCGRGSNRNKGQCDMDGVSINPYRSGKKNLYGPGDNFSIDTRRTFTVKTQFITDNGQQTGNLIQIKRVYVQDGKTVEGGSITDQKILQTEQLRGVRDMGQAFRRKMVLTFSLWDDSSPAHMLWLDGTFPPGSTQPWAQNGPCPPDSGNPDIMRKQVPHSKVVYSKMKVRRLNTIEQVTIEQE